MTALMTRSRAVIPRAFAEEARATSQATRALRKTTLVRPTLPAQFELLTCASRIRNQTRWFG